MKLRTKQGPCITANRIIVATGYESALPLRKKLVRLKSTYAVATARLRELSPTLRQLQVPTLAIFGELDNNIVAEKNKAAWEAQLRAGGNRDYTLQILAKANHDQLEAKIGNNAEMASLQRFVPAYFTTIQDWLAKRIRGFTNRVIR